MKSIKKHIISLFMLTNVLLIPMSVFATETIAETDFSQSETTVEESFESSTEDINELMGIDSETDSEMENDITDESNLNEETIEKKTMTLNITTEFDNFNVDESNIYSITLYANGEPTYVNEEEVEIEYGTVLLNRENKFQNTLNFETTEPNIILTAYISDDYVNAYRIHIDDEEYGYKEIATDQDSYNITLHVSKPDNTITDTNLAPTFSEEDKKYFDGSYGESRAEELESLEDENNNTNNVDSKGQEDNENKPYQIIFIVILIIIVGGGAIVYYIYKKANEEG